MRNHTVFTSIRVRQKAANSNGKAIGNIKQ